MLAIIVLSATDVENGRPTAVDLSISASFIFDVLTINSKPDVS